MEAPVCLCGSREFATLFTYHAPPAGEVRFDFGQAPYFRRVLRCENCGHFLSVHEIDMQALYGGHYVDATYGADGLKRAFDRIVALPEARSDNIGRVARVSEFGSRHSGKMLSAGVEPKVLDVGSGLCVFLYLLRKLTGWTCTALDPDPRAAVHARDVAGVNGVCADFMQASELGRFDLIAFNKVLEHVKDPVAMLKLSRAFLEPGGVVYIELPDGEAAAREGSGREEFFIDHHHVFSSRSIRILARDAQFEVLEVESLREPSGKFTLRAFVTARDGSAAR